MDALLMKAIGAFVLVLVGAALLPSIFNLSAVAVATSGATTAQKAIIPLVGLIFVVGLLILVIRSMLAKK
jgi:hypothetical protein